MKRFLFLGAVVFLASVFIPQAQAQYNQVPPSANPAPAQYVQPAPPSQLLQGTQMHLVLQNGLSTSVAREGDPFEAVVADPVFFGGQLVMPAGARVRGQVTNIITPRHFGLFRTQASMNLMFRSMEVDGREFPVKMSILAIYRDSSTGGRTRRDVNTKEGEMVQERRDWKGTGVDMAIGTGGGSVVGVIFSNVLRGTVIGVVGSAAFVVQKKGKDVELPAQTSFLVRLDSPVTMPITTAQAVMPPLGAVGQ